MNSSLIEQLKNPPREFSPVPFWFLNDDLKMEELERQLRDFNEKGVNAVVLHPRIGIPKTIEYLSDSYFNYIERLTAVAEELDMKIVLYDEAMYPSGAAHGEIVRANPELAAKGVNLSARKAGKIIAAYEDGQYLVYDYTGGTIRGIHFGEDDQEENAPKNADILNPEAVDQFISLTHEQYYKRLKQHFGRTIIGFFTDEPSAVGRCTSFRAFYEGMDKDIEKLGGNCVELRALFEGGENETVLLYRRLLRKRINICYYKRLSDWCRAHHIALMGHPADSADIEEEKYFSVPGQDLVFRLVAPEGNKDIYGDETVQAKCSSDAARYLGCRRNSSECFGVCNRNGQDWYFTGDDMKWFIDWLGIRGVNMFIPHAFYYSVAGERKEERPPDVGPNNIWWKHYKQFSDYMKRISYVMTDCVNRPVAAVLCESGRMPADSIAYLYENQIEFNYLPVSELDDAIVENGKLHKKDYCYEYVINPNGYELPEHIKELETDICQLKAADFKTAKKCSGLRASHIVKNGIHMYFLFNEGATDISTAAKVSAKGTPVLYDLWNNAFFSPEIVQDSFILTLEAHETVLVIMDETGELQAEKRRFTDLGDLTERFHLIGQEEENILKVYDALLETETPAGDERITVRGNEMAECFVNGQFAEVSYGERHHFNIGGLLQPGTNRLQLNVYGSAANRYTDQKIPYGLNQN